MIRWWSPSWWREIRVILTERELIRRDPRMAQLYERHASTVLVHCGADTGVVVKSSLSIHWNLDGGTTLFVRAEDWPIIRARFDAAHAAPCEYDESKVT